MKGLNELTEELLNSVDEARHALDELTLQEGYITTIKRQQRVGNREDGAVKAVDLQCNSRRLYSGTESRTEPLRQRMGSSRATSYSFSATITQQRRQEQPDQWVIKLIHEEHNHDSFVDIKVNPRVRALPEEQEQSVIASLRAGISAGRIVASFRQSDVWVLLRAIYTTLAQMSTADC